MALLLSQCKVDRHGLASSVAEVPRPGYVKVPFHVRVIGRGQRSHVKEQMMPMRCKAEIVDNVCE